MCLSCFHTASAHLIKLKLNLSLSLSLSPVLQDSISPTLLSFKLVGLSLSPLALAPLSPATRALPQLD